MRASAASRIRVRRPLSARSLARQVCYAKQRSDAVGKGGPDIGKRPDKVVRENAPVPQEPIGTESTTRGTAKWWNSAKGYGAIASEKTAPWDISCSFSHIEGSGYRELTPGEPVEVDYFRADQESFKYAASAVRRLSPAAESKDAG
jgi:CspA family cold shock protein